MSKLAERLAKRLKDELGIEVKPIIERTYTKTFDAGEARFTMPLVDESSLPWYVRFEDRAADVAKAKKLTADYNPFANMPRGLDNQGTTVIIDEY